MSTEHEATVSIGFDTTVTEEIHEFSDVSFPTINQKQLAWLDLKESVQKWRIWLMLAYQDIKLRYRRSVLGPFWLTLSMAITVYSMGYLYAHLFHVELEHYFPFLVAGMLSWSLISTIIIELTDGFATSDSLIKQIKLPYILYIQRIVCRNYLIFFHNIFVIVPILIIYHKYAKVNWCTLFLIPGLFIVYINGISYGLILSMLGARYRDISQVIKSLVQVIFFVTPIMWGPEVLGERNHLIVDLNPLYPFIEFIRTPLIGTLPTFKNFVVASIVTLIGLYFSSKMFTRFRSRIVYWL